MRDPQSSWSCFSSRLQRCLIISLLTLLVITSASAQTTTGSDRTTPMGLRPGAPAGSYPLSGIENINLYNGNMSVRLPLLNVGGRGSAGFTVTQALNIKKWSVKFEQVTETFQRWSPMHSPWGNPYTGYGVGRLQGRKSGFGREEISQCIPPNVQIFEVTLTTLTFRMADGTEIDFRDQLNSGQPISVTDPCAPFPYTGAPRGKVFVSTDGGAATFISDDDIFDRNDIPIGTRVFSPSGHLILRDGTRYRIVAGEVASITDRNGNRVAETDQLGRSINFEFNVNDPTHGICDRITYKGFGGADRFIFIKKANLTSALRSDQVPKTAFQLFPELNGAANMPGEHNPLVISEIVLPNGKSYQFRYNSYGEVARIVLPTGGAIEYDMNPGSGVIQGHNGQGFAFEIYRRVAERRTYLDANDPQSLTNKTVYATSAPSGTFSWVQVNEFDGSGTLLTSTKHHFHGDPRESLFPIFDSFGFPDPYPQGTYPNPLEGREFKTEIYDHDGVTPTVPLRTITNTWEAVTTLGGFPVNPRLSAVFTSLNDSNLVSKRTFAYDQCSGCNPYFNNQTDVYEYDFGAGAPGPLIRRSHTDYVSAANYLNADADPTLGAHLRSLPSETWISTDLSGQNRVTRTTYEYDDYVTAPFHAELKPRANISGYDSAFTNHTRRGNLTASTTEIRVNGVVTGSISSHLHYDIAGNVVKSIDPRSTSSNIIATTYDFDDRFGAPDDEARSNSAPPQLAGLTSYAFATKVTNSVGHVSFTQFDYHLGLAINTEDINGTISSAFYNDPLDRPKQAISAVGTGTANQVTFDYNDATRIVTTESDLTTFNDKVLKSETLYDRLGRITETRRYEGGTNFIATRQEYDGLGRVVRNSDPFRPWNLETPVWNTIVFDALGRVETVATPDNAVVTTAYSGNRVQVTDQGDKSRRKETDALGRITSVVEFTRELQDPAIVEAPLSSDYVTTYKYDVLGNLRKVEQGSQTRFFMYDSLSRLIRAKNPEQDNLTPEPDFSPETDSTSGTSNSVWSMAYSYDANGNVHKRKDARNILTTYGYDALNRNTTVSYQNDPASTSSITRIFDGAINGKGRLWKAQTDQDFITIDLYDPLGRPKVQQQQFHDGPAFTVQRTYDLAGNVVTQTYPSGHTVTYQYDAAGRVTNFTGNLGDGETRSYASSFQYDSSGRIQQERYGTLTPLFHKRHYNVRGQLFDVRLSTHSWQSSEFDGNRGAIVNYYSDQNFTPGFSGSDNNGNVTRTETHIPGGIFWQDNHTYDHLDRLTSVTENQNGQTEVLAQHYSYDRYGNRTINAAASWGGINEVEFGVDPGNNRLIAPQGYNPLAYDAAGNLTKDPTGVYAEKTLVYDAENRLAKVLPPPPEGEIQSWAPTYRYRYDAAGRRVVRTTTTRTWQIYGMDDELLAEYYIGKVGPVSTYQPPISTLPDMEYGYRSGLLLVTATNGDNDRVKRFIDNFYFAALGREPSGTELNTQAVAFTEAAGQGPTQMLAVARQLGLLTFDLENPNGAYNARQRTDTEFVTDLYFAYLQRPPDAGGLSAWVAALQQGTTRIEVRSGFDNSIEFQAIVSTLYGINNGVNADRVSRYVTGMYMGVPGSTGNFSSDVALVESAAAESQSETIQAVRTVGINLLQPWVTDTSKTDQEFVTALFSAFLQREASTTELNNWVATVQSEGRNQALQNFAFSGAVKHLAGTLYREILWLTADHLGTPRMSSERSGSITSIKRHDYLPFGEGLTFGEGGRSEALGYTADSIRQKFTSKERDSETGLDYFLARYHSSTQGRFTSVDPLLASAKTENPQTWNRFTYVLNNPLKYVDPDGMNAKDAWGQLTKEEQAILTPKLDRQEIPAGGLQTRLETPQEAFNRIFTGSSTEETTALVVGVKSLIDAAGGHSNSEVWQQIGKIDGARVTKNNSAAITFRVDNTRTFLAALDRSGYDVDRYYENAKYFTSEGPHRHSARQITQTSHLPGLHFVQDSNHPRNRFDSHFDRRSSAFREGDPAYATTDTERYDAGKSHYNPYSSVEVRQKLRTMGIVPKNEP